jgi:hypothetical protein
MIKISRDDTKWAIAGKVSTTALEDLVRGLPRELQGDGSRVVSGNEGFGALLVFGDLPSERLARQLLTSVAPVYLLDFDDDAPVTIRLDRKKTRIVETREDVHPADFLEENGIIAPGYVAPIPVKNVGLIEGVTVAEAVAEAREVIPGGEFEFHQHPRGVLVDDAPAAGSVARQLGKRAYLIFHNPADGDFSCMVQEPDETLSAYSPPPQAPNPNVPALDNILGETTAEGILRALEIRGEFLGLSTRAAGR